MLRPRFHLRHDKHESCLKSNKRSKNIIIYKGIIRNSGNILRYGRPMFHASRSISVFEALILRKATATNRQYHFLYNWLAEICEVRLKISCRSRSEQRLPWMKSAGRVFSFSLSFIYPTTAGSVVQAVRRVKNRLTHSRSLNEAQCVVIQQVSHLEKRVLL